MKLSKEARKIAKELFRASFIDGSSMRRRSAAFVQQIVAGKPRHYVDILKEYHRLVRLETGEAPRRDRERRAS